LKEGNEMKIFLEAKLEKIQRELDERVMEMYGVK